MSEWMRCLCIVAALAGTAETPTLSVHGDIPTGHSEARVVHGHLYAAAIDPARKLATWVIYRVTPADFASRNQISRAWVHALPDETLEDADYSHGPYDRGHLVPLATFASRHYAWQCNWMGVVSPMTPELNRGPWAKLEEHVRELAARHGSVRVTAGPLWKHRMPPLPEADEPHAVPSHYWMVAVPAGAEASAWIVPQECDRAHDPDQYAVTVAEVESRSGLRLRGGAE